MIQITYRQIAIVAIVLLAIGGAFIVGRMTNAQGCDWYCPCEWED